MPMGLSLKQLTNNGVAAINASLSGLMWLIPGGTSYPGRIYNVTVRIRGEVELRNFSGLAGNTGTIINTNTLPNPYGGNVYRDGIDPIAADPGDLFNIYSLITSAPYHIYYLNDGGPGSSGFYTAARDATFTIPVQGNATVTLSANSIDGNEVINYNGSIYGPITIPDIPAPSPQPYAGQFLRMDVVSIT